MVITMVTLLVLAVPVGVIGTSPTAQAQLGQDIANQVLDSVFGTNTDGGTEEEGATETEEEGIAGDDNQDIDQAQEQTNDQSAEATQPITQESSQDETNIVDNDLETGDNTATVAQPNDATQDVAAAADSSDADASAAASAENDDDGGDHHKKGKKHDGHYSGSSDSTSGDTTSIADAEAIVDATAEATGIQGDQSNSADVDQDSTIHDVDLSNNVLFGDDSNTQVALPIADQDQRAANLAEQRAANLDLEETTNVLPYGFTVGGGTGTGTGGGGTTVQVFCFDSVTVGITPTPLPQQCFLTLQLCLNAQAAVATAVPITATVTIPCRPVSS